MLLMDRAWQRRKGMSRRPQWSYRTLLTAVVLGLICWAVWPAFTKSGRFITESPKTIGTLAGIGKLSKSSHSLLRPTLSRPDSSTQPTDARASDLYGRLPLSFEANQGQTDPKVK